jgi:hypothetical protein
MSSAVRRLAAALAATLTVVLLPLSALPAAAGTGSNGPLTIAAADAYLFRDCARYPIRYTAAVGAGFDWELSLSVQEPSGAESSSTSENGTGPASGSLTPQMCDLLDGAGTYGLVATLTVTDPDTFTTIGTFEARTTWVLRRAASAATILLARLRAARGSSVGISGRATAAAGPYASRPAGTNDGLKLRYRDAGSSRWRLAADLTLDRNGRYAARVPVSKTSKPRVIFVAAFYGGNQVLLPSRSRQVKLRIVR